MKKKICLLLILCVVFLVGCGNQGADTYFGTETNTEVKKSNNIMYHVHKSNNGMVNIEEDYWSSSDWTVYYNGDILYTKHYNLSEDKEQQGTISNDDLNKLAKIGNDNKNNATEQSYTSADAPSYDITYYDENGTKYELTQFTDNSQYNEIITIVEKYYK